MFTAQFVHAPIDVAPLDAECLPASHCVHSAEPNADLYLPAAHDSQVPPSGPLYPMLHRHCDCCVDPLDVVVESAGQDSHVEISVAFIVSECLPTGQSRHADEPMTLLYLPATHATQVPLSPSGPENPALHLQSVIRVLPTAAVVL